MHGDCKINCIYKNGLFVSYNVFMYENHEVKMSAKDYFLTNTSPEKMLQNQISYHIIS